MKEKEYLRIGFGLSDKKLKFKTEETSGKEYYSEIELKGHCPEKFELIEAKFKNGSNSTIIISFRAGGKGDNLQNLINSSATEKDYKVNVKMTSGHYEVRKALEILFLWREYNEGNNPLVPETAGGSILVGI